MSEERALILAMLKEGKITIEEADALLEAIHEESVAQTAATETTGARPVSGFEGILQLLKGLKRPGYRVYHTWEGELPRTAQIQVKIPSGKVSIQRSQGTTYRLKLDAVVPGKNEAEAEERLIRAVGVNDALRIASEDLSECRLELTLPRDARPDLDLNILAGVLEIDDVDLINLKAEIANGKVVLEGLRSERVQLGLGNGKVDARVDVGEFVCSMSNGKLAVNALPRVPAQVEIKIGNGMAEVAIPQIPADVEAKVGMGNIENQVSWLTSVGQTQRCGGPSIKQSWKGQSQLQYRWGSGAGMGLKVQVGHGTIRLTEGVR